MLLRNPPLYKLQYYKYKCYYIDNCFTSLLVKGEYIPFFIFIFLLFYIANCRV